MCMHKKHSKIESQNPQYITCLLSIFSRECELASNDPNGCIGDIENRGYCVSHISGHSCATPLHLKQDKQKRKKKGGRV